MSDELRDLLDTQIDDAAAPVVIPTGEWTFEVDNAAVYPRKGEKAGGIYFVLRPLEPGEDVDAEEAEEYVGDGLEGKTVFHRQQLRNQDDVYQLGRFLKSIRANTEGKNAKQAALEAVGMKIVATVSHDPNDQNPEQPWVRLRGFGPASED